MTVKLVAFNFFEQGLKIINFQFCSADCAVPLRYENNTLRISTVEIITREHQWDQLIRRLFCQLIAAAAVVDVVLAGGARTLMAEAKIGFVSKFRVPKKNTMFRSCCIFNQSIQPFPEKLHSFPSTLLYMLSIMNFMDISRIQY